MPKVFSVDLVKHIACASEREAVLAAYEEIESKFLSLTWIPSFNWLDLIQSVHSCIATQLNIDHAGTYRKDEKLIYSDMEEFNIILQSFRPRMNKTRQNKEHLAKLIGLIVDEFKSIKPFDSLNDYIAECLINTLLVSNGNQAMNPRDHRFFSSNQQPPQILYSTAMGINSTTP